MWLAIEHDFTAWIDIHSGQQGDQKVCQKPAPDILYLEIAE
jgi:hypothetical protein